MDESTLKKLVDLDFPDSSICDRDNPNGICSYSVVSGKYETNSEYEVRREEILSRPLS